MAGHSKFKNIMHRKGAQDAKRAKVFTKLVREIIVAAKTGNRDREFNPRLRLAIASAKAENMPKDKIENAIKKATSAGDTENYTEIRYEGYGPGGTAFIVNALTDNKNRTAAEIRKTFSKHGGNLGESGSVSFMFNRIGSIIYDAHHTQFDDLMEQALELGAEDCIEEDDFFEIITRPEDLSTINTKLEQSVGTPIKAKVIMRATGNIAVDDETGQKVLNLLEALEDNDDVQDVIGNFELPDSLKA